MTVHNIIFLGKAFIVLHGALALFTFNSNGSDITCNILHNIHHSTGSTPTTVPVQQVMVVEKQQWHGLTAAPSALGYTGQAIVFETNGRMFDPATTTKVNNSYSTMTSFIKCLLKIMLSCNVKTLAPFAPIYESGVDGDPSYYAKIIKYCPSYAP